MAALAAFSDAHACLQLEAGPSLATEKLSHCY